MQRLFILFFLVLQLSLPLAADAALVTCGGSGQPECQACELISTTNNVVSWLIQALIAFATLMFAWAGVLLLSARGEEGQITKAKGMFGNVFIGIIIMLAAWLIIDTVMKTFLPGGVIPGENFGPWNEIKCVVQPETIVGDDGEAYLEGGAGGDLLFDDDILADEGVCSRDHLNKYFSGRDIIAAACVARAESACGGSFYSKTDLDANREPFSVSPYQINLTVHEVEGCGPSLDCKTAYKGRNYDAEIEDRDLYDDCVEALTDVSCASKNAARIKKRGGWRQWSTAKGCGLI